MVTNGNQPETVSAPQHPIPKHLKSFITSSENIVGARTGVLTDGFSRFLAPIKFPRFPKFNLQNGN